METLRFNPEEVIIRKGEESNSMYLIKSGLVGVYADLEKKGRTMISLLGKGKFIGEMGVINHEKRSADVVALEKTELVEIPADDFSRFVAENTTDVISIMKNLSERLRRTNADLEKAAKTVGRFVEVNKDVQDAPVSRLKSAVSSTLKWLGLTGKEKQPKMQYAAGEVLFEEGDIGTHMFQIIEGEAGVVSDYGTTKQAELAVLTKGAIFGEMAVVEEERRTATVVAKTDLTVNTVANGKLKSFLTSHPEEAMKIMGNMSAKLRKTTAQYLDTLASISEFVAEERGRLGVYMNCEDFIMYADYYDEMIVYNPAIADTLFFSKMDF